MRNFFVFVVLLSPVLGACAQRTQIAPPPSSSNTKVSFGIYDISSSSPTSRIAEAIAGSTHDSDARSSNVEANAAATQADATQQNISLARTSAAAVDTAASDRKIIRNAELDLEANDPEEAQRQITSIAEAKGGFVVDSQQSSSDTQSMTRDTVVMTVRVPSERFNETLAEIRNASTRVVVETVKGQDVTEEFIDIEAQLKAKKALEQQFMEIMKRATTVDDALSVQSQLAQVRGEIERVEGRKRFLDNQSSLSTIKIRLRTPKAFAEASDGFGARLSDAFGSGLDVAVNFILGFVTFIIAVLPFAMLIGLPSFLVIRYVLRRQSRPKSVTQIAEEEISST